MEKTLFFNAYLLIPGTRYTSRFPIHPTANQKTKAVQDRGVAVHLSLIYPDILRGYDIWDVLCKYLDFETKQAY